MSASEAMLHGAALLLLLLPLLLLLLLLPLLLQPFCTSPAAYCCMCAARWQSPQQAPEISRLQQQLEDVLNAPEGLDWSRRYVSGGSSSSHEAHPVSLLLSFPLNLK